MWQHEFYRLLESNDQGDVDAAYALKERNLPAVLCKYRAPTPSALANLRDDTAWLSPASQFNDPFDTSLSLDVKSALAELLRRSFVSSPLPSLDSVQMGKIITSPDPIADSSALLASIGRLTATEVERLQAMESQSSAQLTHALTSQATMIFQGSLKICCFSSRPLSMAMWSHYSHQHEGFCVLYQTSTLKAQERRHLYPVIYTTERFSLARQLAQLVETNACLDPNSLSAQHIPVLAATRKSPDWAYEEEWRLIFTDGGRSSGMVIPMPRPAAIHLGCRLAEGDRSHLLEIAGHGGIPCCDVALADTRFELQTVPVVT